MAGIKFEAEGYGEFKKSLREIQSSLKVVSSELRVTKSEFDKNDNSVAALTAKNKTLSKVIEEQKKYVDQLAKGVKAATEEFGENDKRTQALTIQYNKAQAELNNLEREFKDNENAMKDAENATEDLGRETKNLGDDFEGTGKKSSTFGDMLKANLSAQAIIAGVKAISMAVKEVAQYVGESITATAEYGDAVDKQSQKLRVSAEEYQKLSFAAERSGMSVETFSTAQKTLASTDFNGNLFDAVSAVASIADENERAAKATELFGKKAGQEMLPLLNSGTEGIEAMYAEIEALGGIMSNDAVASAAKFEDSLTNLKTAFGGLKNNLAGDVLPAITEVMDGLSLILTGDTSGLTKIQEGITKIVDEFSKMLPKILEVGAGILQTLGEAIIQNLPTLAPAITSLITGFVQFVVENLPMLIQAALEIVISLANGIAESLPELIPAVVEAIITIVKTLIDNVDKLIDAAIEIIIALADGLITALPILIEKAPEIVINLLGALIENAPKILAAGIELIGKLIEGIWSVIASVVKAGADVVGKIGEGIKGAFDSVVQWGKDIIDKLMEGLKAAWESVVTWFNGVWNSLFGNRTANVTVNKKVTGIDGSNAAGLDYVPFDGYISDLHKGEMVIPANLANGLRNLGVTAKKQTDLAGLMASSVNAINMQGGGNQRITIEIPLSINGKEFYRASISDLWSVMSSNPRVVSDAI